MQQKILENKYFELFVILIIGLFSNEIAPIKLNIRNPLVHLILFTCTLYYLNNNFIYSMIFALIIIITIELSKKLLNEKFGDLENIKNANDTVNQANNLVNKINDLLAQNPQNDIDNQKLRNTAKNIQYAAKSLKDASEKAQLTSKNATKASQIINEKVDDTESQQAADNAKRAALVAKVAADKALEEAKKSRMHKTHGQENSDEERENSDEEQEGKSTVSLGQISSGSLDDTIKSLYITSNVLLHTIDMVGKYLESYIQFLQ